MVLPVTFKSLVQPYLDQHVFRVSMERTYQLRIPDESPATPQEKPERNSAIQFLIVQSDLANKPNPLPWNVPDLDYKSCTDLLSHT